MKRCHSLCIFLLSSFLILTLGCTWFTPTPQRQQAVPPQPLTPSGVIPLDNPQGVNLNTPELGGGPERLKRETMDYKQIKDLSSRFPGVLYYEGSGGTKLAALTFDDGPDRFFTSKILAILKSNGVKATFFIVGRRAEANPDMVKNIAADGHAIGNHSWDHSDFVKLTPEQIQSEISRTDQVLYSLLGYHPAIFRPPYGALTHNDIQLIAGLGYKIIDWSVDTRDWAGTPPNEIMDYVQKEFHPGGIILEHCAGGKGENLNNTVAVLPQIISTLKAQGFSFVTIPQLLKIPATKP